MADESNFSIDDMLNDEISGPRRIHPRFRRPPESPRAYKRLCRVEVDDLFGLYNHRIQLRVNDRITILHGPNGVGKTVVLRFISSFSNGEYLDFGDIPFGEMRLSYIDGSLVTLSKTKQKDDADLLHIRVFDASTNSGNETTFLLAAAKLSRLAEGLNSIPQLHKIGDGVWFDANTSKRYTATQAFRAFRNRLPRSLRLGMFEEPPWLITFRSNAPVYFIETQRLLLQEQEADPISPADASPHMVDRCARHLAQRIREEDSAYGGISRALDQSFPQRLLQRNKALDQVTIQERLADLDKKRSLLQSLGLIDARQDRPLDLRQESLADSDRSVLTLYLEDSGKKLDVFSDLQLRVEVLLSTVNKKFRNKELLGHPKRGLRLQGHDRADLRLTSLSSGEQHELVLLYELLFKVEANALVLVDEPELSLHIEWQKSFLPDLIKIVNATGFDVLLATHSPFVVGERIDLMESLSEESDE